MIRRGKRLAAVIMLVLALMMTLSGCWDSHELDAMLIITGVALDKSPKPGQMDITLEIGETIAISSGSGEANTQQNSSLVLKATSSTLMGGIMEINRDSSHKLLLHHNQVLLVGTPLAEQGIEKRIDLFMREPQARMEVPVVVVEGRADKTLSLQAKQDRISGIYLQRVLDGLSAMSPFYRVRLLDFASRLLYGTWAPVAPIIKVVPAGDQREIRLVGMAVFKGDRMVGRLNNTQATGYLWSMGNVRKSIVQAGSDLGKAVFRIEKMDCKREVTLRPDGGVRVALSVEANLYVEELSGFNKMAADELTPCLIAMAQDEIRRKIMGSFTVARRLNADIYGFGTSVYRKYPKEWKGMESQWDEQFRNVDLHIQTRVHLRGTGQIGNSLEMKGE